MPIFSSLSLRRSRLGAVMLARGLEYTIRQALGWQGILQASIAGALVFALGFTRWRHLRQR